MAQAGLERAFLRKPGQVKPELIEGKLPLEMSFLTFEGNGIHMTAFKKGQKKDDLFVRFVNHMEQGEILSFKKEDWMKELYRSNENCDNARIRCTVVQTSYRIFV